jgi:hypothetical protein
MGSARGTWIRPPAVVVGALVLFPVMLVAQADLSRVGLPVGAQSIPFELPDQNGRIQTLGSVAGPNGTMLVFTRSADW